MHAQCGLHTAADLFSQRYTQLLCVCACAFNLASAYFGLMQVLA